MIGAWMLYGLVVGGLVAVAAASVERLVRAYGWPARWVWAAAVAGTAAAPVVAWVLAARPAGGEGGGVAVGGPEMVAAVPAFPMETAARPVLEALSGPLAVLWAMASAALVLYVAVSALRLRARRKRWRMDSVEGERVLVSPDLGPAVLGWLRGTVVLPEWALRLNPGWRRLVIAHERQHVRAYDPALLALGVVALALYPWNVALWWQVRGLRLAVEMDCDERVLREHPDVSAYGGLLIEVGRRAMLANALLAALSEPRSFLERRIRRMVSGRGRRRVAQVAGLAVVTAGVLVLACQTPVPDRLIGIPDPEADVVVEIESGQPSEADLPKRPALTPYTVAPELKNGPEVVRALERYYPPLLRDAGIGGSVLVWIFIDETGAVRNQQLRQSSGHEALDEAALKVAELMRFTPAMNMDRQVPVWISLPIEFRTGAGAAEPARPRPEGSTIEHLPPPPPAGGVSAAPTVTPYTVAPELRNRAEVMRALAQYYPPLLRDAGIGGSVLVWFFIDENGAVRNQQIRKSSGHEALDEAALKVAELMQFTPARNMDKRVPVWISLPIEFHVK